MSWGKHFASMYEGSMRGAGSAFFAVWGYVISHMRPSRKHGAIVELNPDIVAFLIGEDSEVVARVIAKMCRPDPASRTKDKEGRKLIKLSEYSYAVVNGAYYRSIRNEAERREYQRIKQAEYRKKKGRPLKGEDAFVKAVNEGADPSTLDRMVTDSLPKRTFLPPPE